MKGESGKREHFSNLESERARLLSLPSSMSSFQSLLPSILNLDPTIHLSLALASTFTLLVVAFKMFFGKPKWDAKGTVSLDPFPPSLVSLIRPSLSFG